MTPVVSVVVPAHNVAAYLDETLRSLEAQHFTDWESVIVDDGSTDDTASIAETACARDARHRLIRQPASGLAARARNAGLALARGRYVAFLDADDVFTPDRLARTVTVLDAHPEVAMVFADFGRFVDDVAADATPGVYATSAPWREIVAAMSPLPGGAFLLPSGCRIDFVLDTRAPAPNTLLVTLRRDAAPAGALRFREDVLFAEDIDLYLRAAAWGRVAYVDAVLAYYRVRPGSVTQSAVAARRAGDEFRVRSDHLAAVARELAPDELRRRRGDFAREWWGVGYNCAVAGLRGPALRAFLHSLSAKPTARALAQIARLPLRR
jgi:glycosyltransferase involved in cell wall biosynthesis